LPKPIVVAKFSWRQGGGDVKKRLQRPRLEWVYSRQRLANDKLVKIFTHARYDLRAQPYSTTAREEVFSRWEQMRTAIFTQGLSGELDLLRIVRAPEHFPLGLYDQLEKRNRDEVANIVRLVDEQAARGLWIWQGSAR
jgi:hypothetical protein